MMLVSGTTLQCPNRASLVLTSRVVIARGYRGRFSVFPRLIQIDAHRIPPSKSWSDKKEWWEERRKQARETNERAQNSGFANPWQFKSTIIVERPQVITPPPEPWFEQYQEWRLRWDAPILAQYPPITVLDQDLEEIKQKRDEEEKNRKDLAKKLATETEEEKKEREAKEERERRLAEIRASHEQEVVTKKRSRETEADRKGDTKSLYRALDKKLFLIVKKNRKEFAWQFPQGLIEEGETIRVAAEREFNEECNVQKKLQTHFTGYGPMGVITYEYPAAEQKKYNTYGCKAFFMYSYYLQGQVTLNPKELVDYRWVTKDELKDYFDPRLLSEVLELLPNDGKHEYLERQHYFNMDKKEKE